jgi:AraC family transcriptional activator of pobA
MKPSVPTYELYGEEIGTPPEFWLHCETIPSRSSLHHWEIRRHRHESFFQILYIEAGSGDAIFEGVAHPIQPPAVVTVPSGAEHGFRFSRDIDGFVFTVLTSHLKTGPGERSRFGAWLATPRLTSLAPDDEDGAYMGQTLRRLASEFECRTGSSGDLMDAYLTSALTLLARLSAARDGADTANDGERRMEALHTLLQRHFRSQQTVAFYAARLGISPTHLNRVVRAATGQNAHALIVRKVTDEAKRELVFNFESVQAIAFRLGFADPAYFSRFFLKHTGATPRAWRITERAKIGL